MQGNRHQLNRFRGLYVELLLPDSWLGEGKLTEELVQSFVDRQALSYPARARGRITAGDSDFFTFVLTSPRRVRIEL